MPGYNNVKDLTNTLILVIVIIALVGVIVSRIVENPDVLFQPVSSVL